ncbi:hypothetical protein ACPCTO_37145, partial [Streptomyces olivoreticuli]
TPPTATRSWKRVRAPSTGSGQLGGITYRTPSEGRSLNAVRVSFGAGTPTEHIERFVHAVKELVCRDDGSQPEARARTEAVP